jgi:pilus assembly protein CpaF
MQDIFTTKREGEGMVMRATGIVPALAPLMHERGFDLDHTLFDASR